MSTVIELPAGRKGVLMHRVSENAFVRCARGGWLTWDFAYLLRGSFGNYLLGEPAFDPDLARLAEGMGGIAKVLPFRPGFHDDAARWFTRFGCEWIAPAEDGAGPRIGPAPRRAPEQATLPGLADVSCRPSRGGYGWHFRWRDTEVLAGLVDGRDADRRALLLPGRAVGSRRRIEESLAVMQSCFARFTPSDWLRETRDEHALVCWPVDSLGLIACYDDNEFERGDLDMIDPTARSQIAELLAEQGYERMNAHCYRRGSITVRITRPPRAHWAGPVEGPALRPGEIRFVTPTQAALHLLRAQRPPEELDALLERLPVNLRKLEAVLREDHGPVAQDALPAALARWASLQHEAVAFYRRRRPNGIRGRLYAGR